MATVIRQTPWKARHAPSLEDFEILAEEAFTSLPPAFRALCGEIIIRIADFPEDDVLEDMEIESAYDLLGLFVGTGLAHQGSVATGDMPNMIWLYRRPILDYWAENEEALGHLIAHVLIHEIGHHFGLSDDDMEAIENAFEEA